MPLTDIAVRKATPREKPYRLADGGGMYLEVAPSGGKYWRLKYRFAGKEKRLALGVYPDVSLAAAREKRDDARKKLAADIDPGEAKKAEKRAVRLAATNSFEAVALGWMGADDALRFDYRAREGRGDASGIRRVFGYVSCPVRAQACAYVVYSARRAAQGRVGSARS